jgi:predicted ribosomally synthesized peptide with nif11-like leader
MSEEQLAAFLEAIQSDVALQDQIKAAGDDANAVVAIAKTAGFVISAEEFKAKTTAELSDAALEGVAGGAAAGVPTADSHSACSTATPA